jgi:hypothetical protein
VRQTLTARHTTGPPPPHTTFGICSAGHTLQKKQKLTASKGSPPWNDQRYGMGDKLSLRGRGTSDLATVGKAKTATDCRVVGSNIRRQIFVTNSTNRCDP